MPLRRLAQRWAPEPYNLLSLTAVLPRRIAQPNAFVFNRPPRL